MPDTNQLQFEMERRTILFNSGTTMPDNTSLGYEGNPNYVSTSTAGQTLLYNSPRGTSYIQLLNGNLWYKQKMPNTWINLVSGSSSGSFSSNVVYTFGNQTIFGNKTFAEETVFGDPTQNNIFLVSGNQVSFGVRPTVNGTGVLLVDEATKNTVYTTGAQIISGIKTFDVAPILNGNPFITGVNLSSYVTTGQTGVFYPRDNPSGFITGVNLSSYVTTGQTGVFYPRDNPSGFITGVNLSSYVTTGQTGVFYPRNNPSGFISSADFSRVVYTTGDQTISGVKGFASRPTVNGTGVLLIGEVTPGGLPDTIVYTTGNQTISGIKTFNVAPILSGNPFITGVNLSSYITTGQTGVFYPRNNPSGFISSADFSRVVYTTGDQTISGNKTFRNNVNISGTGNFNSVKVSNIDRLLLSGIDIEVIGNSSINVDNNIYIKGNPVLTGVIPTPQTITNVVYTTGTQTISGIKTFDVAPILSGNPFITGVNLSSYVTTGQTGVFYPRNNPSGFITGVNLSSYVTTGQTGVFYPRNNPSGFISSADFSRVVYTTGNQTISGIKTFNVAPILSGNPFITGVNLSSYVTTGQTGDFYPRSNPSGFISSVDLTPYALANQVVYTTGNQTISGNKTFAQDTVFGDSTEDNIFVVSGNQISFGVRPTVNGTGVLLSGEAAALGQNVVYTTGDQTISGVKTFVSRPTVNGTGVLLSGEAPNPTTIVYITGDQVISGVKSFTNNLVLQDNILFSSQASGYLAGLGYSGNYDGGYFLGRTKLSQNTSRLVDSSFGNTWVAKQINRIWRNVSISSDGKYQTAVVYGDTIYVSSDYGNTWVAKENSRQWYGISISSDGKYQSAVVVGGQIYVSSDYGNSWVVKESSRQWIRISISSDGKYQTAVVAGGQIYVSSDYGNSWVVKESSRAWTRISISSDGKYQTAVPSAGQIYVSSDYGNSWVVKESSREWYGISISSDGKYQTAVVLGGQIYVSSDYGNSWVAKDSNRNWYSASISSDGKYQSAVDYSGQIYVSSDYGNSWVAKESNRGWVDVSISSDGKYISAVVTGGQIYTSKTDEKIDGNLYADNLVYNIGNQNISGLKNFYSRPTVNGTGVLLSGEASNVTLPATVVYTTGNQTISGNKTFAQDTVFGDSTEDNIFVVSGNQISFGVRPTVNGTGVLLSGEAAALGQNVVYTTGDQTISGIKTFANTGSFDTLQITNKKLSSYNYINSNFGFGDAHINIVNTTNNILGVLPNIVTSGMNYYVKNINSGTLAIVGQTTIDGFSTVNLYKNESLHLLGVNNIGYTGWVTLSVSAGVS